MENPSPRRVSLRHVGSDGQVHDVVGELVQADDHQVVVLPHGRGPQQVPRASIRAMKWAPPRMVRPTSRVDDLERLLTRTWPGTQQTRMGGWVLRTGAGVTQRANSVLPAGDPELPLVQALQGVTAHYRSRGLRPTIQTSARDFGSDEAGAQLDRDLASGGWHMGTQSHVLVRDLTSPHQTAGLPQMPAELQAAWVPAPDDAWLQLDPIGPQRLGEMTAAPARYLTLRRSDEVVARARLAPSDDWVVLAGLLVSPRHRRQGLGRALTVALLERARDEGFGFAALQVEVDNHAAVALYQSLGFTRHHDYRYWSLPAGS